ncbi:hypothetical protein Q9Q99_16050 [Curtobacterium flaccumfaciens]|nr:hypothetical protein Q9Q99_16050 [Curtobacterium flaccumfaciens]
MEPGTAQPGRHGRGAVEVHGVEEDGEGQLVGGHRVAALGVCGPGGDGVRERSVGRGRCGAHEERAGDDHGERERTDEEAWTHGFLVC